MTTTMSELLAGRDQSTHEHLSSEFGASWLGHVGVKSPAPHAVTMTASKQVQDPGTEINQKHSRPRVVSRKALLFFRVYLIQIQRHVTGRNQVERFPLVRTSYTVKYSASSASTPRSTRHQQQSSSSRALLLMKASLYRHVMIPAYTD